MHSKLTSSRCIISGTGLFSPTETINNDELVTAFNSHLINQTPDMADEERNKLLSSSAFIEKASGIQSRHVVNKQGIVDSTVMHPVLVERADDELSLQGEMAVAAAKQALKNAGKQAADIDAVIVACSNLQRAYPAIAIEVQAALGIQGFAYDMNVACSSATFGISNAVNSIVAGQAKAVLVINPEICSGHLDFTDRDCHFIFGDACTALVVEHSETVNKTKPAPSFEIVDCQLVTQFSNNIRNNFGFLNRSEENSNPRDKLFMQNGRQVFKEVCPMAAKHIRSQCEQQDLDPSTLKRLWLHQANLSMNELIAKKVLGKAASREQAPVILDQYANTSSAGSIIAFHLHNEGFEAGEFGLICSFGAGYSIGSVLLKAL
ncbi:MAG: beta-ketoacyl-ACP synthase III [Pseudomonadales bacterium]|nr:beta-ketoacyl-ACP synthase III [Pseudomonadales bacterium]